MGREESQEPAGKACNERGESSGLGEGGWRMTKEEGVQMSSKLSEACHIRQEGGQGSVATARGGGWPQLLSLREERREMSSFPSTGLSTKLA